MFTMTANLVHTINSCVPDVLSRTQQPYTTAIENTVVGDDLFNHQDVPDNLCSVCCNPISDPNGIRYCDNCWKKKLNEWLLEKGDIAQGVRYGKCYQCPLYCRLFPDQSLVPRKYYCLACWEEYNARYTDVKKEGT